MFHGFTPFVDDVPFLTHKFATDAREKGGGAHYKTD
jgi:hypothetical protein